MIHSSWHTATFCFGDALKFRVQVEPLYEDEPMELQRVYVADGSDTVTLVLTADQADELEQQLERGRWHRAFRQQELTTVRTAADGTQTVTKPDDPHSGGWTATIPAAEPLD